MAEVTKKEVDKLLAKYEGRLQAQIGGGKKQEASLTGLPPATTSKEYEEFLEELRPAHVGYYEKACNFCGKLMKMKVSKKRYAQLKEEIEISHLNVTPEGIEALSLLGPLAYIMIGAFLSFVLFNSSFFAFFFIATGGIMILPLKRVTKMMADAWRMKASNQMVLCVFYIVTFMRQTKSSCFRL